MLKPLKIKRQLGRPKPKRNRCKDPAEKQVAPKRPMKGNFTCSTCKGIGHNARSCTNEPAPKKPKSKLGRPKKTKDKNEVATSTIPEEYAKRIGYIIAIDI
ncbi:hypothetical protein TorRG33x02_301620 [Trema orientale]|uniref:Zinc finger, CCHC-type n=1 Tax=Trema orientale TaxID=63057 RepID=A0A2P5C130_TREOI|nr:hypothetical protein TorRG33x02_301620 [Trema orientale]